MNYATARERERERERVSAGRLLILRRRPRQHSWPPPSPSHQIVCRSAGPNARIILGVGATLDLLAEEVHGPRV